jgi:hypothetical protein
VKSATPYTDVITWDFLLFYVALEVNDHAIYQAGTTALDVEQQTLLMEIMRIADEAAVAAAAAAAGASVAGAPPGR